MSFVEIFTLFAAGATIFGLIVGVFSVYNGRMTRREIGGFIRETQAETQRLIRETHADTQTLIRDTHDLIAREAEATRQLLRETHELIAREAEATRQLLRETQQGTQQILRGITEILGRIEARVR